MNNKTYANYLMHGRTKGSRNGISTTKGYTAVGQKAKGHLVNGKYVYDDPNGIKNNWQQQGNYARAGGDAVNRAVSGQTSRVHMKLNDAQKNQAIAGMTAKAKRDLSKAGSQNNWQQQAALEQWKKQNQNNIAASKKAQALKDAAAKGASNNWQQQANAKRDDVETYRRYKNNTIGGIAIKDKTGDVDVMYHPEAGYTAIKTIKEGAATKGSKNNWQQQANTQRAMKEYMTKASAERKAKAQAEKDNATQMGLRNKVKAGAANNWQQQASERAALGQQRIRNENGTSSQNSFYNKNSVVKNQRFVDETPRDAGGNVRVTYKPKADNTSNNWQQNANKTAGILGNMSREDRSLMKSKEWTSTDKDGTKKTNNSFNVNNKYGYSNYTKSDNGWHDVHMGEYNTTGVKGVKKQQDWNTSYERNHRSDIGNAVADAKADAKKAFKEAKADAKQAYVNLKNKIKKKKKK